MTVSSAFFSLFDDAIGAIKPVRPIELSEGHKYFMKFGYLPLVPVSSTPLPISDDGIGTIETTDNRFSLFNKHSKHLLTLWVNSLR